MALAVFVADVGTQGSVTDFAVFAAQHLGHVMTTLAVQYERGDIAAHHDRTTPTETVLLLNCSWLGCLAR
eukprot:5340483-Amphidinium_carterae.1